MEQKRDNKSTLIIALLLVIILILIGACYFAYSRYTSTSDGNATATVAKWNFGATETKITNLDLATTSAEIVDFSGGNNLKTDKIAPGTASRYTLL